MRSLRRGPRAACIVLSLRAALTADAAAAAADSTDAGAGAGPIVTVIAGSVEATAANAEQFSVDSFVREAFARTLAEAADLDEGAIQVEAKLRGGTPADEAEEVARQKLLVNYRIGGANLQKRKSAVAALTGLSAAAVSAAFGKHLVEAAHSEKLPSVFGATIEAVSGPRLQKVHADSLAEAAPIVSVASETASATSGSSFCCMMAADVKDTCGTCFPIAMATKGTECGESRDACLACGDGVAWCASGTSVAEFADEDLAQQARDLFLGSGAALRPQQSRDLFPVLVCATAIAAAAAGVTAVTAVACCRRRGHPAMPQAGELQAQAGAQKPTTAGSRAAIGSPSPTRRSLLWAEA